MDLKYCQSSLPPQNPTTKVKCAGGNIPGPLNEGGLTMSPKPQPHPGIWKHKAHPSDPDVKVADFSYQNEDLAQMIVQAWGNPTFAQGRSEERRVGKECIWQS